MADFSQAVEKTIEREGGSKVTNDPHDRGGVTKFGISKLAYPHLNIKKLEKEDAVAIYKQSYWHPICGGKIHQQAIAESVFDCAVNMGVKTSSKLAQRALGITDDGMIGPITLRFLNEINPSVFLAQYALEKIRRYKDIVTKRPDQIKFLVGWINRTLEI